MFVASTTCFRAIERAADLPAHVWDACANPPGEAFNPFVSHAFYVAVEESKSAIARTGWRARHLVLEEDGAVTGIAPCYAKNHSYGEYVFDHGWADAYERAGGRYYPKLQAAVPFTPATGPRFLASSSDRRAKLAEGLAAMVGEAGASSAHVTFLPERDWSAIGGTRWLKRMDTQFHWFNRGYASFDDFLANLAARKRKNIKRERAAVADAGIEISAITGSNLREEHWDAFFAFYMDTGSRKWGSPYLTRDFFSRIGETMRAHVLLVMCKRRGRWIAGALNFIGGDALYGRNWGAIEQHDCLHFEACYYQAIDYAITHGLSRVEAGAQGPHKLARGYVPVPTYSLHYLADPRLARAVADYLERERRAVAQDRDWLARHAPFRAEEGI
jgi:predicted N-acyltransferase